MDLFISVYERCPSSLKCTDVSITIINDGNQAIDTYHVIGSGFGDIITIEGKITKRTYYVPLRGAEMTESQLQQMYSIDGLYSDEFDEMNQ